MQIIYNITRLLWGENMSNKKKKKNITKSKKGSNKSKTTSNNKNLKKKTSAKKTNTKGNSKKASSSNNNKNVIKNNKESGLNNKKISIDKKTKEENVKRKISISRIVTLFILICIVLVCGIIFNKPKEQGDDYEFRKINYNVYEELFNGYDISFIYIIKDDCSECSLSKSNVSKLENEMNIKINELNISNLSLEEINNVYNGISAPVLISVKNGEIIKEESATRNYKILKEFVTNSQKPIETYSFNNINVSEYIKLLNAKETTYIYICSDNSCKNENSILDSVSKSKNIKVNYLNLDEVTTVGDWELLNNSNDIFKDTWFVPVNIIVKNGKIKSYNMEVLDEDGLIEFLEDNGM